ncbi:MAG: hypothetical protein EHM66_01860, partial [Deltaproteobacteria bacterium]
MAFDAGATRSFGQDTANFLRKNYVKVSDQGHLTKTRTCRAGATWAPKSLGNVIGQHAWNSTEMTIQDADLVTTTGIGGRTRPTAFVGLDKVAANNYLA